MSFKRIDIEERIKEKSAKDSAFAVAWEHSRNEYELLHEVTRISKEQNLTQKKYTDVR